MDKRGLIEESVIKRHGFKFTKRHYFHEYITNCYKKGYITIEFTYKKDAIIDVEVDISKFVYLDINMRELKLLDSLVNKKTGIRKNKQKQKQKQKQ